MYVNVGIGIQRAPAGILHNRIFAPLCQIPIQCPKLLLKAPSVSNVTCDDLRSQELEELCLRETN